MHNKFCTRVINEVPVTTGTQGVGIGRGRSTRDASSEENLARRGAFRVLYRPASKKFRSIPCLHFTQIFSYLRSCICHLRVCGTAGEVGGINKRRIATPSTSWSSNGRSPCIGCSGRCSAFLGWPRSRTSLQFGTFGTTLALACLLLPLYVCINQINTFVSYYSE